MNFSGTKFILVYFIFLVKIALSSTNTLDLLPKAADAVADYFSANCVHFLSSFSSTETFINHRIAKIMSLETEKFFSFSNISSYYNFLRRNQAEHCTVPLRIVVHLKDTEIVKDFKDFHDIYENYSIQANAGLWLFFLKSMEEKFIAKVFRNFYLPLDLEILGAWVDDEKVHLKEFFQVSPSNSIRQTYFGCWSSDTGMVSSQPSSRYFRRTNLEGVRLEVGYMENNMPFTMTRSTAAGNYLDGYFGKIWLTLEDLLNISTSYVPVELSREKDENKNSWLRIMKMLQEKKIDVGLGDFIPTAYRIVHFDFSYPLLTSHFQLYYKVASEFSPYVYLLPFQTYIWVVLFNWWIFSSVLIFVTSFLTLRFSKTAEKKLSISTCFFMIFGALCAQGSAIVPRSPSCRVLFLLTYIVAAVMIPSYSANLTHYLKSELTGVTFDNIFDFYKAGTHEIILIEGSFEYYFFNVRSELSYFKKIFEQLQVKQLPKSFDEALLLLCTGRNVAFFTITSTFIWGIALQNEHAELMSDCALKTMTQDVGVLEYGLIFPKNSRFKGIINHQLKILQQSGVIKKFEEEFWINQPKNVGKNWKTVSLKESFGVFQIVAFGIILSVMMLFFERLVKNIFSARVKRKFRARHFQLSQIRKIKWKI